MQLKSFTFNPFQENTYIIYNDKKEALIIDPGMYFDNEKKEFDEFIKTNQLVPVLLLNTHTHLDHVFGNAHVVEKYNIKLAMHELDLPVYDTANTVGKMYGLEFDVLPRPDFFLKEQEKVALGDQPFEIFLTPGHSPGSVCFYNANHNWVISGDVLFQQSIGRSDLLGGNYDQLIQSIHKSLLTLPDQTTVFSGHGPETTIGLEKMNNPFLR